MKKPYVLVVEDEKDLREILKYVIEDEGIEVKTASNGLEALSLLEDETRPAVMVLDPMMPVMDGWELIEEIKKKRTLSQIPLVIVSAFSDQAKGIRADHFLNKPIDMKKLIKILRTYVPSSEEKMILL